MAAVRDYMDADPISVRPEASVEEVARVLGENELHGVPAVNGDGAVVGIVTGHNRIPVVEGGRLAGVISRADVVRALADGQ